MIFKIKNTGRLEKVTKYWDIKELELENYLVNNDEYLLEEDIFGEELFFVKNQAITKDKKRADILALDKNGNGVIIELKKEKGRMGVETQALQYLAAFSQYKGEDFIDKFNLNDQLDIINNFLYEGVSGEDINCKSRIILLAQYFDPALFSMGEWLAENRVAFKCISFEPIVIKNTNFLQFSVKFDQKTTDTKTRLVFSETKRKIKNYWHNIEGSNKTWWEYLINKKQISASFDNQPGDKGEAILKRYRKGDIVFAYASKNGCIGYGIIDKGTTSYKLIKINSEDDKFIKPGHHLHRLSIDWKVCIRNIKKAITSKELKEIFQISHPIQTSSSILTGNVEELIKELQKRNELEI